MHDGRRTLRVELKASSSVTHASQMLSSWAAPRPGSRHQYATRGCEVSRLLIGHIPRSMLRSRGPKRPQDDNAVGGDVRSCSEGRRQGLSGWHRSAGFQPAPVSDAKDEPLRIRRSLTACTFPDRTGNQFRVWRLLRLFGVEIWPID